MSIARALKEKNRISGKIAKLQYQVNQVNRFEDGKKQDFNSRELLTQLQEEWAHLINLKNKIAAANIGIADKLIKLTEAKAELQFWNTFTNAGQEVEVSTKSVFKNREYVDVEVKTFSTITSKEIHDNRERVQQLIETLQDDIDEYNAKTQI
jgi:hypothetical protein